jgi:hypothetical protein
LAAWCATKKLSFLKRNPDRIPDLGCHLGQQILTAQVAARPGEAISPIASRVAAGEFANLAMVDNEGQVR